MTASLSALRSVADWVISGGEYRAGLPPGSMGDLQNAIFVFQQQLQLLNQQLINVRTHWQALAAAGQGSARSAVEAFVVEICQLDQFTKTLVTQATDVRVEGDEALTMVRFKLQEYPSLVAEAEQLLAAAQRDRDQAFRDLEAAKAELEGDKGFWNGVLTGITFTAVNPIQDNINKANAAVSRINSSYGVIQNRVNTLNQTTAGLRESEGLLADLYSLDADITDYENSLNAVQKIVSQAYADEANSADALSAGVANYFRRSAGKEMASLLAWIDVFESTLG